MRHFLMGRKVDKIRYELDAKGIKELPFFEIKAVLRAADDLIMKGGRSLLAKILKGSRDKKILELELEKSPAYGFFKKLTIEEIMAKIDWTIENRYLAIEYDYRLPLLVYTKRGWEIEKDTYSDELLEKLSDIAKSSNFSFVQELKDRDRGVILLLLDKIEATGDKSFIPALEAWAEIDYKKVSAAVWRVIRILLVKK